MLFVGRRIENALFVEFLHNFPITVSLYVSLKNQLHSGSSFCIYNEMVVICWVDLISIWGERTDKLSMLSFIGKGAADFGRNIFDIHFIVGTCKKSHRTVHLTVRVSVVCDANKADAPFQKLVIDVLFDDNRVTRKAGLVFAEDKIDFSSFTIR